MKEESQHIWDVFISHASEDKALFVEPLALAIEEAGYRVWYDRFTLKWGDSLRQSIERGLEHSRYGIVVLSKAFFRKRWPQAELDGLFEKERQDKKVILPIWHGVTAEEVQKRTPIIAAKLALSSDDGVESIVSALADVLGKPSHQPKSGSIKKIEAEGSLPDLENLARNVWWLANNTPHRKDLVSKLEDILDELRDDISQWLCCMKLYKNVIFGLFSKPISRFARVNTYSPTHHSTL